MERLTKKHYDGNGYYMACSEHCNKECFDCKEIDKIIDRLGTYEDSGLEPGEIADFMKRWEQAVEIGGMLKKYGIDHIWDIIQAEQDGRLSILSKSQDGTCGSCGHFNRIPGKRCGTCGVRSNYTDRWGRIDARRGAFTPSQSRKCCKQYIPREEAEAALKGGEG